MKVIPAIIPKNFDDLVEKVSLVKDIVPVVQVDVVDGKFVPSQGWPFGEDDMGIFSRIASDDSRLPFWDDVDYELDLMIKYPAETIDYWANTGASRLIIHYESTENLEEIIGKLQGVVEIGLAVGIDTPNEKIYPYMEGLLDKVDFVQFMGISKIGFQGEPFDERVLEKIKDMREKYPDAVISVDGGVTLETAPKLFEAGANRLASGSAILKSENIEETITSFNGFE